MEIIEQNKDRDWTNFIIKNGPPIGTFIQSWQWGEFYKKLGRTVERYFIYDDNTPIAAFTLVYQMLPFGFSYGYAPRGPIIMNPNESNFNNICEEIRNWALKEKESLIFLRLEPPLPIDYKNLPAPYFKKPSYYVQPKNNLVIDLSLDESELLESIHQSTKANINRAIKRGVDVIIKNVISNTEFNDYKKMMEDTTERNHGKNIYPSDNYFKFLFEMLFVKSTTENSPNIYLTGFYGYSDDNPAATHFVSFYGKTATYLYGASYSKYLNTKVTTLLHWSAILEAKKRGMKYYDIGGIDEKRWPSLTEFKKQFGGKEIKYLGNIDIPIQPFKYKIFNLIRRMKNL